MAKATGGQAYLPQSVSDVVSASQQIAGDIRHQYTLGYTPANPTRGQPYHPIRVVIQAPGHGKLHVRTRAGYLAAPESPDEAMVRENQSAPGPGGSR